MHDHQARPEGAQLVGLLSSPASVAIVGASATPGAYSYRAFTYLRDYGFAGELSLVNPNRADVEGHPCVPAIADIPPGTLDLAMVAVRADQVAQACAELAGIGTRAAVAIAGGMDAAGKQMLRETVASSDMRIIGPNCIGVVASRSSTYLSFSRVVGESKPRRGRIALVTQSGAMGNALMLSLLRRGAGISHWITTGDEVDVGALELIAGLLEDDDVGAVGVFFEGMGDLRWMPAVRDAIVTTGKQVYVVKGAQTAAGRGAAAGHTGRVVGSGEASVAVMRDAGITVVQSMPELADVLIASEMVGRLAGRRVGIVSISGGSGVLAADAVVRTGRLELGDLGADPALEAKLGGRVHEITNPLDVAGSPTEVYADWANTVASRPSCDVVIAVQANILHDEELLARELADHRGRTAPLVVVPFSEDDPLSTATVLRLASAKIPVMASAERAIVALAALPIDDAPHPPTHAPEPPDVEDDVLGLEDATALLGADLPWARHEIVDSLDAAIEAAGRIGFPLVLKAAGRALHHRSDTGGVLVGVTAETLPSAMSRVAAVAREAGDAVMVQAQAPPGAEVMVSVMNDAELGAVAIVRLGGVLTEVLDGSAILWGGWDSTVRRDGLERSIVGRLLMGYRGGEHYDIVALAGLIERLLGTVAAGQVDFLELNPVIVASEGVHLVDALVRRGAVSVTLSGA